MWAALTGIAGPGVGVACVTVVMALPWLTETEGATSEEEEGSVESPCIISPPC